MLFKIFVLLILSADFINSQLIYNTNSSTNTSYLGLHPIGCNKAAAAKCEYDYLYCKLFQGPANDPATICKCSEIFYGECINEAGCLLYPQVSALSTHQIYMSNCISTIISNDCSSTLQCGINCASEGIIDSSISKILPFNNYGSYYLRVKICIKKVHPQKLSRYSFIDVVFCKQLSDFEVCSRWIPPHSFVPVAVPINATYLEVDSCEIVGNKYNCLSNPAPVRIYGNQFQYPKSLDIAITNSSFCTSNGRFI